MINYSENIRPRVSDINYGNHVGHSQLLNLIHETRLQFLNKIGLCENEIKGHALVMRNINIDYINQAFWANELQININLRFDGVRIIFDQCVYNLTLNNKTAKMIAEMVLVDKITLKLKRTNLLMEIIKNGKSASVHINKQQ